MTNIIRESLDLVVKTNELEKQEINRLIASGDIKPSEIAELYQYLLEKVLYVKGYHDWFFDKVRSSYLEILESRIQGINRGNIDMESVAPHVCEVADSIDDENILTIKLFFSESRYASEIAVSMYLADVVTNMRYWVEEDLKKANFIYCDDNNTLSSPKIFFSKNIPCDQLILLERIYD